jgi:hypothetical protein
MDIRTVLVGEYIAAVEIGDKRPTVTIDRVEKRRIASVAMEGEQSKEKDRAVVFFQGKDRGWVLNKTNALSLAAMFGNETEAWKGKRVTLYAELVQAGRKHELGIRVAGSPDLEAPVSFDLVLPRKRPKKVTLEVTGKAERANGDAR